jgi:hypothetical protein
MQEYFTPIYFEGYCPECLLKGEKIEMQLNENDFWECPMSLLQITTFPPYAVVLGWRGDGKFRSSKETATMYHSGSIYTQASKEPGREIYQDESLLLRDNFDLEDYVSHVDISYDDFLKIQFDLNDLVFK